MTAAAGRVPAVGGTHTVPVPDPVARDYLLLGLRLDQHLPGIVDGYFGPADLKAQVDLEQLRPPARLAEDAASLRERVAREMDDADADRRAWLDAQLVAIEAHAASLAAAGEPLSYAEHAARAMGFAPLRRDAAEFASARSSLDRLLPGPEPLADRLDAWDRTFEIALDRLPRVVDWLVARFRSRAKRDLGLPPDEDLRVSLVTNQPWSGYNWYDGGLRSRVAINTDLPVHLPDLIHTVAHETYPGHHLEHAWKEWDLVNGLGRLEASMLLLNTPECPISEGLADVGAGLVVPAEERADLIVEAADRAGLAVAGGPVATREAAELAVAISGPRRTLGAIRGNAAFLRHDDGRSHEEVFDYLQEVGGYTAAAAAKRLEFIEHPLWRTYVFVYADGEALLTRWLERVPEPDRMARFGRLLHEQVTPSSILAELDGAG